MISMIVCNPKINKNLLLYHTSFHVGRLENYFPLRKWSCVIEIFFFQSYIYTAIFSFLIIVYENCTRKRFKVIIFVNILQMIFIFHHESDSCDTFHNPYFKITNTIIHSQFFFHPCGRFHEHKFHHGGKVHLSHQFSSMCINFRVVVNVI